MAALSEDVKRYIVMSLACFDTPSEVAEAVKAEFGLEVTRQHVEIYDPTKKAGKGLGPKLRELFTTVREQFEAETIKVPVALRTFRLRALQAMYYRAVRRGNDVLGKEVLEQAAKETGGLFTNARIHSGSLDVRAGGAVLLAPGTAESMEEWTALFGEKGEDGGEGKGAGE